MENSQTLKLQLNDLDTGLTGISPRWGQYLCEASSYCLTLKNHIAGVEMLIGGDSPVISHVFWENTITDQTRSAWNDTQELTEYAATGIALLLVEKLTGYTVIRRSFKGTGIDYWLGEKDISPPFQNAARLEISGIIEGNDSKVNTRLKQKRKQITVSDSLLPAYIIVVEFSKPTSHVVRGL